jgi:hypothetical protein
MISTSRTMKAMANQVELHREPFRGLVLGNDAPLVGRFLRRRRTRGPSSLDAANDSDAKSKTRMINVRIGR